MSDRAETLKAINDFRAFQGRPPASLEDVPKDVLEDPTAAFLIEGLLVNARNRSQTAQGVPQDQLAGPERSCSHQEESSNRTTSERLVGDSRREGQSQPQPRRLQVLLSSRSAGSQSLERPLTASRKEGSDTGPDTPTTSTVGEGSSAAPRSSHQGEPLRASRIPLTFVLPPLAIGLVLVGLAFRRRGRSSHMEATDA